MVEKKSTKKCPVCKHENDASEVICTLCMADISGVCPEKPPLPVKKPPLNPSPAAVAVQPAKSSDANVTVVLSEKKLRLKMGEVELEIEDGDILGRDTAGKTFLQAFPGVSRKHAVITYNGKAWEIEDLGSTNGTYINSRQITSGKKAIIKSGDKLGISKKVVFEVK